MAQDRIDGLQVAIRDRGYAWKAASTPLSDLPPEAQMLRLGLRPEPTDMARIRMALAQVTPAVVAFPPAWDWRDVKGVDWTTPPRDQGECGACVAISVTAVMETMLKRAQGKARAPADLSEAHLFFCGCGDCCESGWWPPYALDYAQKYGVPDEAAFPYPETPAPSPALCETRSNGAIRVVSWQEIIDVSARKAWLARTGPTVGCLGVYEDLMHYAGGVYRHVQGTLLGYHAVCVVGYSEAERAWIAKSSWGTKWGEGGWCKIGYGECGIDTHFAMYGVAAVASGPAPVPRPAPGPPAMPTLPSGCNPAGRLLTSRRRRS